MKLFAYNSLTNVIIAACTYREGGIENNFYGCINLSEVR